MSRFSNWVGVNRAEDLLDPKTARSILSAIEALKTKITGLQVQTLFDTFMAHANNTSNPHQLSFGSGFSAAVIESLYPLYVNITKTPMNHDQFVTTLQNPVVLFELMRRLILNQYLYQEGIGPVTTPVYTGDDLTTVIAPSYPSYFASEALQDVFFENAQLNNKNYLFKPLNRFNTNFSLVGSGLNVNTLASNIALELILTSDDTINQINIRLYQDAIYFNVSSVNNTTTIVAASPDTATDTTNVTSYKPFIIKTSVSRFGLAVSSGQAQLSVMTDTQTIGLFNFVIISGFSAPTFNHLYISDPFLDRHRTMSRGWKVIGAYAQNLSFGQMVDCFGLL